MEFATTTTQTIVSTNLLSDLLSNEYVIYSKTTDYHLTVVGPDFVESYDLFLSQLNDLEKAIRRLQKKTITNEMRSEASKLNLRSCERVFKIEYPSSQYKFHSLLSDHVDMIACLQLEINNNMYLSKSDVKFLSTILTIHNGIAKKLRELISMSS